MSEENQALQQQLQQKREKDLEKLRASVSLSLNGVCIDIYRLCCVVLEYAGNLSVNTGFLTCVFLCPDLRLLFGWRRSS